MVQDDRAGIEQLSGLSMAHVQVHHASPEPARLGAEALGRAAGPPLTGVAVAFVGIIAFVGLVVPHVIRMAIGFSQRAPWAEKRRMR